VSEELRSCRPAEGVFLPTPRPRIGVEVMGGRWVKTSDAPQWIERLDVTVDGDALRVHVRGGTTDLSPADWGEARSHVVYAGSMTTGDARSGAFVTRYELDGMDVDVQANLNLGLLVVATFVSFRSPSPFTARFTREFFRRDNEPEARR
jgi:hypothetical protein